MGATCGAGGVAGAPRSHDLPPLPRPDRASAACTPAAAFCLDANTNASGFYGLFIPANYIQSQEGGAPLDNCTWQVEADYGDGSPPGKYVFEEDKLFTAGHTFPEPGVYDVVINATEGQHIDESPCPDLLIEATITYPEPPPQEEAEEAAPGGPGAEAPGGGGGAPAAPPPAGTPPPAPPHQPYWSGCGGGVRAHLIACRKAKRVIRSARAFLSRARLEQGASFRAAGFTCRLRGNGDVACRRGRQRVLGA
ncbi:MAG TPA: hypothetical protein VH476_04060 [Solirubrobacterales bacterium]|jgi:hypothetical protein